MKLLTKNEIRTILSGANLLGTGGGGILSDGINIVKNIKNPVKLISLEELKPSELVCTVYGIGGSSITDANIASKRSFEQFQKIINKKVSALVSVENGADSIATAMYITTILNIPLLNSDIVGLRSSPEIFLETITIKNLSRTPCVIADDKGNNKVVMKTQSPAQLEKILRRFAVQVGGDAYVAGYPLRVKDLKNVLPKNSITLALKMGKALEKVRRKNLSFKSFCNRFNWKILGQGIIQRVTKDASTGFAQGAYTIIGKKETYKVLFKNENIILLRNGKVALTCPDSISLLNKDTYQAINNFENNKGARVFILGRKAIPIWRTKKGKKLFSPKTLGFSYRQKLLT